jgi:hypothetical protein
MFGAPKDAEDSVAPVKLSTRAILPNSYPRGFNQLQYPGQQSSHKHRWLAGRHFKLRLLRKTLKP